MQGEEYKVPDNRRDKEAGETALGSVGRLKREEIEAGLNGEETLVLESWSAGETAALGRVLGEMCRPGQVYTLTGDLGTGKTVFTQGFARGLGITEPVSSPTFTILQVYDEGRLPFYHFDVYRIGDVEEMEEVGCEDCFYGKGVCMVEWAELIAEILPENSVQVTIEKVPERGFDYRRLTLKRREIKEEKTKYR